MLSATARSLASRRCNRFALGIRISCGVAGGALLIGTAPAARSHGPLSERAALAEAAVAEAPEDPSTHLRRAAIARDVGDIRSALSSLESAENATQNHDTRMRSRIDAERGLTWLAARDIRRAVTAFDRAIAALSLGETPAAVFAARARARAGNGDLAGAVADYDRAIDGSPTATPSLYLERADTLRRTGQPERALAGLDEGLVKLGAPVTLALAAVELERRIGRHERAVARLDRAALGARVQSHWQVRRARLLEESGELQRARQSFSRALVEIRQLPAARRRSVAMAQLEDEAAAGVERLATDGAPRDAL